MPIKDFPVNQTAPTAGNGGSLVLVPAVPGSSIFLVQLAIKTTTATADNIIFQDGISTPALVQGTNATAGIVSSVAATYSNSNASGNLLIAVVTWDNQALTASVADATNGAWTAIGSPVNWSTARREQAFFFPNCAAHASTLVTATFSGTTTSLARIAIFEFSGVMATSPLDVIPTNGGTSGTSTTPDSGSATTTNSNDLIFGAALNDAGAVLTKGATFANTNVGTNTVEVYEYKNVNVTGSVSADASMGSSNPWVALMSSFKAAVGPTILNTQLLTNTTLVAPYTGAWLAKTAIGNGLYFTTGANTIVTAYYLIR